MLLYLVRHGQAKESDEDPERHLTDAGERDVRKVAACLRPLNLAVGAVWHSGKTRAAQTAEILAAAMKVEGGVSEEGGLAPNDPVAPIGDRLAAMTEDLAIVGHLPLLGNLAAALVAGDESADLVAFRAGGALCLERGEDGAWVVRWMIVPQLLR